MRLALIALFGVLGAQGIGCGGGADDPCSCDVDGDTGRRALACVCADGECGTLQDVLRDPCTGDRWSNALLERGCGKVRISQNGGFAGGSRTYDEASGALIGTSSFSDVQTEPCNTFDHVAGEAFDCSTATACTLCPSEDGLLHAPPCPED